MRPAEDKQAHAQEIAHALALCAYSAFVQILSWLNLRIAEFFDRDEMADSIDGGYLV